MYTLEKHDKVTGLSINNLEKPLTEIKNYSGGVLFIILDMHNIYIKY